MSPFLSDALPEKRCFKCGEKKDAGDFYCHPEMASGRLGKCKECTRIDVQDNRRKRVDQYRAYEAERYKRPERKAAARRVSNGWARRHPERYRATTAVNNAVRDGRLMKPTTCELCGSSGRIHGHHHDYAEPLAVTWLCPSCHHHADHARRTTEQAVSYV